MCIVHKSPMKVVQSKMVESQIREEVLDMEEGQDMFDPEFYLAQYQVKNVKDRSMKTMWQVQGCEQLWPRGGVG